MSSCSMEDLVSQAEENGVTLAQVISSSLSAAELDSLQSELMTRIEDGYRSIAGFMEEVDVPSCPDFSSLRDEELLEMQHDIETALSDGPLC